MARTVKVKKREKEIEKKVDASLESRKLAVIKVKGKQYLVREGATITVDHLGLEAGAVVPNLPVLLYAEEERTLVGEPELAGVRVGATVVESYKGKKIDVIKFKAKSRYSKKIGFRPLLSKLKVSRLELTEGSKDGS